MHGTGTRACNHEAHLRPQWTPGWERSLRGGRGARGPRGGERRWPEASRHGDGMALLNGRKGELDSYRCRKGVQRLREPPAGLRNHRCQVGRSGHGEPAVIGLGDARRGGARSLCARESAMFTAAGLILLAAGAVHPALPARADVAVVAVLDARRAVGTGPARPDRRQQRRDERQYEKYGGSWPSHGCLNAAAHGEVPVLVLTHPN